MQSNDWKKINTLTEIPKHFHGKGVSFLFLNNTKKETLLHTNKSGFFSEQNKYNKNTTTIQWIKKFNTTVEPHSKDTIFIRTVLFVTTKSLYIFSKINQELITQSMQLSYSVCETAF